MKLRASGEVRIKDGQAILTNGKTRLVLIPYLYGTQLDSEYQRKMGGSLFAHLHGRTAKIAGELIDNALYGAQELQTRIAIRDIPVSAEKEKAIEKDLAPYFRRDALEIARRLNFAGIVSLSALYHRLKSPVPEEMKAMSRYLQVPETELRGLVSAMEKDTRHSALITAPPTLRVSTGVNMNRLRSHVGIKANRKAPPQPPSFPSTAFTPHLPAKVDHRSKMTPVRDQGDRGTCVAHAAAALLEHKLIQAKKATRQLNLSEQYLYWAIKQIDGAKGEAGSFIEYGVEVLKNGVPALTLGSGTCKESIWRYDGVPRHGNESHDPLPPRARIAPRFSAVRYQRVRHDSIEDLKSAIADGHCVGLSVFTYHFWNDGYVRREGIISLPLGIEPDGAHAICLVGYEDSDNDHGDGYFVFKNSWGPLWGGNRKPDRGFGTLPYRYILKEAIEAWIVDI